MVRVPLYKLVSHRDILAGAAFGREVFGKLCEAAQPSSEPRPHYIDFSDIEMATASFLRESVVNFKLYCRSVRNNLYPVAANCCVEIQEEIDLVLKMTDDAMMSAIIDDDDAPVRWVLLGNIDKKLQSVFDEIVENGVITATMLENKFRTSDKVGITAWNNRLASLSAKGVAMEKQLGRQKVYTLPL